MLYCSSVLVTTKVVYVRTSLAGSRSFHYPCKGTLELGVRAAALHVILLLSVGKKELLNDCKSGVQDFICRPGDAN